MDKQNVASASHALERLLGIRNIQVTCLGEKKCREGFCDATISQDGGTFTCVTGIIPNADYLGEQTFALRDVIDVKDGKVIVMSKPAGKIMLEPRMT